MASDDPAGIVRSNRSRTGAVCPGYANRTSRKRISGADPSRFGVFGVDYAWGIAEVRGNAIRDLAALNKVEMLPWDEWGRMEASYAGETGADFDELVGTIASVCESDDESAVLDLYASSDLAVPPEMIV